ncbi:MAG: helix-turn-helix transcriptional regulator [Kiritimatiellae bacterium]|nr:helix-turn-helix transcriptional regulator [Kiritimatiellia bacterium]
MSSRPTSTPAAALPLGAWLRQLRQSRHLPIRAVAAAVEMDTAHLSKIELGQRLPTETQCKAIAAYFDLPPQQLQASRIAARFLNDYGSNPAASLAVAMIKSQKPYDKPAQPA